MLERLAKTIYRFIPNNVRIALVPMLLKMGISFGAVADEAILLSLRALKVLKKSGKFDLVIHVGGHKGQEAKTYEKLGAKVIIWVEADPRHIQSLQKMASKRTRSEHKVVHCIASSQDGQVKTLIRFNNDGASNSVCRPNENMKTSFPGIHETNENVEVNTRTLPSILDEVQIRLEDFKKSLLVLDVQGHELEVLNGCDEAFLENFEMVVSEVSPSPLYHASSNADEVISKLRVHHFLAISEIPKFHGDVVFKVKTSIN